MKDPEFILEYLKECLADGAALFFVGLSNVCEASFPKDKCPVCEFRKQLKDLNDR